LREHEMSVQAQREEDVDSSPPGKLLLAMETRVWAELAHYALARRTLARELPRGDGSAVLIVPGFGADDFATRPLRRALRELGYAAHGWGQKRNLGMRPGLREALNLKLYSLQRDHGKVTLIGWSLGGVFVREMARHQPECVRRVITLGSPINGHPNANNMLPLFKLANRGKPMKLDWEGFQRRRNPPPVPCTAIYSKSDGIVAWRCSREEELPNTENIEVSGSHFGLCANPKVIRVIADRLARDSARTS
ncbi:MAG TPA: alpha/beta hydrolase, partial [Nevskiaceae bacterium]|nr:alpha/beta hydrolase [Nevskiaceae bacterium]